MPIIHINTSLTSKRKSQENSWRPNYPNPADFRFDYFKLLNNAQNGLADLAEEGLAIRKKVAIVGAGCAGMVTARELYRCGLDVTIYEASDRIGGRLYTEKNPSDASQTGMEMGAMRMPFFNTPDEENCILSYYLFKEQASNHKAKYAQFPNPGNVDESSYTGIYLNDGKGPNGTDDTIEMIRWDNNTHPQNDAIADIGKKVTEFVEKFDKKISSIYVQDNDKWELLWGKIVAHYGKLTFDDLVFLAPKVDNHSTQTGDFGGFGLNSDQASLLYTIGTGDGSWGAFYSVSALWFIRCTMFGFGGKDLKTIIGLSNAEDLPFYELAVKDTNGLPIPSPTYKGIQSLVEYLYFTPPPNESESLHESKSVRLFTKAPVDSITKLDTDQIQVTAKSIESEVYDFVFITSTQWASQMSFRLENFPSKEVPTAKTVSDHTQHNISSCKLFFPLKEKYWEKEGNTIPQVIVTDTFLQDSYALSWDTSEEDKGVILASYTWEDDSLKLLPLDTDELSKKVLEELKRITTQTLNDDITNYIDKDKPVTIQWITKPSYIGCAKLYRQRDESLNTINLSYNQNFSKSSNLYFVGENYSVEGGWTEPALRSALDGVIHLLNNLKATFKVEGFNFENDYPKRGSQGSEDDTDQKCQCTIS